VICKTCRTAADYDEQWLHEQCVGCDCHHMPIEGEPRLKVKPLDTLPNGIAGPCGVCGKVVALRRDGKLRKHKPGKSALFHCVGVEPDYEGH
jgi:hypothetical protein